MVKFTEEYQELTDKEQEDLEKLLKEEERRSGGESAGVQDIAVFTENLSQQLGQLDDANIHMLMGSEEQIQRLMGQLDASLTEIQVRGERGAEQSWLTLTPAYVCESRVKMKEKMVSTKSDWVSLIDDKRGLRIDHSIPMLTRCNTILIARLMACCSFW